MSTAKKCVFSSPLKIGTDRPFWEVYFGKTSATFNLLVTKAEGNKIDFLFERTKKMLISDLAYLFPEYIFLLEKCEMKFTLDIFIEDRNYKAHQKHGDGIGARLRDLLQSNLPFFTSGLKNVFYFGRSKENSLGTFSSLMQIKKWRDSL